MTRPPLDLIALAFGMIILASAGRACGDACNVPPHPEPPAPPAAAAEPQADRRERPDMSSAATCCLRDGAPVSRALFGIGTRWCAAQPIEAMPTCKVRK